MVEELKKKVEAILFSAGSRMQFEEIRKLCRARDEELKLVLEEMKQDYEKKDSSIMLVQEGDFWKLTIREKYLNVVRRIVTQTELTKSIMETLAVIAWKYPVVQSDVIKIRTNKAYDHLNELEQLGYISRQKYGRTKLIKLTQKFFDYFDLPEDKLKEVFKDFTQLAGAIEKQEAELETKESVAGMEQDKEQPSDEQKIGNKEPMEAASIQPIEIIPENTIAKSDEESQQPEIDLFDSQGHKEKLRVFEEPESRQIEIAEEKLGELEVVDELPEENTSEKESAEEYDTEISPEQKEQEEAVEKEVEKILKPIIKQNSLEKSAVETPEEQEEDAEKPKKSKEEQDVDNLVDEMMYPKSKSDEEPLDDEQ